MSGLIHVYCGDGKGKTTAAVGLAVRAAGAGKRVLFVQFSKDGSSSEIGVLASLPGVEVCVRRTHYGFFKNMSEDKRRQAKEDYTSLFAEAVEKASGADLIVLDELISACNHGLVCQDDVLDFLKNRPENTELVITGRAPSPELLAAADYITEMKKLRHPLDAGIAARKGIEF